MAYQKRITATDQIRNANYEITVFGDKQDVTEHGNDMPARVSLAIDSGACAFMLRVTPNQARQLAANIALAAIACEEPTEVPA